MEPLYISLTNQNGGQFNIDEERALPEHNFVIRPLLENSLCAYVYGLKKGDHLYQINEEILIKEKGKLKFDLSKECLLGHEKLWNAIDYKRGSIIIILENGKLDFSKVFKKTYDPALLSNPNTGNTISAIKKCRDEALEGKIACCFTAANGINWLSIYAVGNTFDKLVEQAFTYCKQTSYYKKNFLKATANIAQKSNAGDI